MAQKPGSGTTQTMATSPDTAGAGPSTTVNTLPTIPESDHLETTETSGMTGTTLAGGEGDKDRSAAADGMAPGDEVVIAPVEPVTLPDDEVSRKSLASSTEASCFLKTDVLRRPV